MRELKFRIMYKNCTGAWIKDEYGLNDLVKMDGDGFLDDDDIIEQYTGLKDKNGKEIYDGDIVEQFVCGVKRFKGKEAGRKTVWQVRWNKEECCFELHYVSGSLFGDSLMSVDDDYEIIGNIHENPELLGDEE